jgi:hypothetical protein
MDTSDGPDLRALRSFRAADAAPPPGLLDRLRDDLQLAIDAEQSAPSPTSPPRRTWWQDVAQHRLFRPALVAGAAACLLIAVAGVSAVGPHGSGLGGTGASSSATQASTSIFDGTARSLFGKGTSVAPPVVGVLDTTEEAGENMRDAIVDHSRGDDEYDVLRRLTRDPNGIRDTLRSAAADAVGAERAAASDQTAFLLAMGLVTDERLPAELRASVLLAVGAFDGIEAAAYVHDDLSRPGILISHFDAASGVRDQYVLDQATARVLEQRSFTSMYVDPACPPGTFSDFRLYDDAGDELTPEQLPTLDWPPLVPSCSPAANV